MPQALERNRDDRDVILRQIAERVERFDLADDPAWQAVRGLAKKALLDGIAVEPAGIVTDSSGSFRGIMNVYVLLEYDDTETEGFQMSEAFRGTFDGHMGANAEPVIDQVSIDVSPFYLGEEAS